MTFWSSSISIESLPSSSNFWKASPAAERGQNREISDANQKTTYDFSQGTVALKFLSKITGIQW